MKNNEINSSKLFNLGKDLHELSFSNHSSLKPMNANCEDISYSFKPKNNYSLDYHNIDQLDPFTNYDHKNSEPDKDFNKIENQFSSDLRQKDSIKK